jgi:hypothetical protein
MSDLRSAIAAGPAATITASDISDIASAVWANTIGARVDSRLLQVKSNVSDVESQIDAGVPLDNSTMSDLRSAVLAGPTDVQLNASSLSDIRSAILVGPTNVNVTKIDGSSDILQNFKKSASTIVRGTAIAGTLSTTQMSTDLTEATNDHYKGRIIIWTSGTLINQATDVTAYTGATKVLTYTATTEAPLANDTFVIV